MRLLVSVVAFATLLPSFAFAFPFGGQASTVVPCYNEAIYANLGAPRGGPYIWTPSTKTYQFGPPSFSGQWLLGLASAPYYCIVSIEPVIVWPGTAIDMMGSSGSGGGTIASLLSSGASGYSGSAQFANPYPTSVGSTAASTQVQTAGTGSTAIGHAVISEIFADVDPAHGSSPADQWVEIYNGSASTVDLSGWTLTSSEGKSTLPSGTSLASGAFLVILDNANTASYWSIPSTARSVSLNAPIAGGLSASSDDLLLKNASGTLVDSVSWGNNTTAFQPAASAPGVGQSLARTSLARDTGTASDWAALNTPEPGQ